MLVIDELPPKILLLTRHFLGFVVDQSQLDMAQARITAVMDFFEALPDRRSYIVGNAFT